MTASGPRGSHDCQPGGGRCTLIAGAVFSPYDGQRAAQYPRLPTGRGPMHPDRRSRHCITQRAAAASASTIQAGARAPDRRRRTPAAGRPTVFTGPGPAARPRLGHGSGPGPDHQPVGPTIASPLCRRCSQSSRRTLAARQVRGTDPDTSRRRPRSQVPVGSLGLGDHWPLTFHRLRFVSVQSLCGPLQFLRL